MVAMPIRHSSRSLRRTPAFTLTALVTLIIGIGAVAAIFAVVNGVLLTPLPYGSPDRLVGTWHDLPPLSLTKANQTAGTYFTYKKLARSIESIGLYGESAANVSEAGGAGAPQRLASAWITASIIPTLQVAPLLGRNFTEAEDLPRGGNVVIISEGLWRTRFGGDPAVIGRSLEVNGVSRQIVGVMPRAFRFPNAAVRLWIPLALDPANPYPGGFNHNGVARLKPGVTPADAERDFLAVLPHIVELFPFLGPGVPTTLLLDQAKPRPVLIPLLEDITGGIARTLWMVAAAAGLVLLVACANVANLILVRADQRQREIAVREALGAGRAGVLSLFMTEALLLAGTAAVGGLGLAWLAVRALAVAGPADIPRLAEVGIGPATLGFVLVVALLVAAVCTVIPALRVGRTPQLSVSLREGGRSGTAGCAQHRLRGAMVAFQVALALVVLAGSGLLLRTFQRLHAVEPGFTADHVATFWMSLPSARYSNDTSVVRFFSELQRRVAELPGVRNAGLTSRLPLVGHGMNSNPFYTEDDAQAGTRIPPLQIFTTTDAGYFQAMGIPLLAGRGFDRLESQRRFEAIISQRTAEQFWKDPTGKAALGKRFRGLPSGPWYTIIGVVGNTRDTALAAPPSQAVYFPEIVSGDSVNGQTARTMALVVKTQGDPADITAQVQQVVRALDPTLPTYEVRSMEAVLRASTAQLSFTISILGAAAVVTLLLGAIGLYGVLTYLVTLRTRELGVRIALGAEPRAVARMITGQGLVLTGAGIGAGLVLFALVARFLESFLFGVEAGDPLTLGAAALALIAISALASWIPARRASRVDPAGALRAE
jgi:putative ABC transport system permease protein